MNSFEIKTETEFFSTLSKKFFLLFMKRELLIISYLIGLFCLKDTLIVNKFFNLLIMDFVNKNIEIYVEALSDKESPLLREINEYTIDNVHQPRMLSGHLQGRILSFISKIKQPKNILEIGTYTGYSALCLAEGLDKGGKLITIDRDKTLHDKVYDFFKRSEYSKNIEQIIGEAIHLIPEIDLKFDLVFIDADKKELQKLF